MTSTDGVRARYSDRIRPAADTVAAMRPHFPALGITRLARQTGLDRIGIPCFAAIRPNSATIATHQGKGLDDDAAMASAIMEAAEYAIAERPEQSPRRASARGLGPAVLLPDRQLPMGSALDSEQAIDWYEAVDVHAGIPTWVAADAVAMGAAPPLLSGLCRTTNGLASGNSIDEAIFHGTCELIERDATTLWSLKSVAARARLACCADDFADAAVRRLAGMIAAARFRLTLFDLTSDIAVPTVMAVIGAGDSEEERHFGLTAGYGTHPVAARAAVRAITEAAQGRVTIIAGARDDILPSAFRKPIDPTLAALLDCPPAVPPPAGLAAGTSLPQLQAHVREALAARDVDLVAVPVGGASYGIAVVKMFSRLLEDREPNANWRPGPRSLGILLEAAA